MIRVGSRSIAPNIGLGVRVAVGIQQSVVITRVGEQTLRKVGSVGRKRYDVNINAREIDGQHIGIFGPKLRKLCRRSLCIYGGNERRRIGSRRESRKQRIRRATWTHANLSSRPTGATQAEELGLHSTEPHACTRRTNVFADAVPCVGR